MIHESALNAIFINSLSLTKDESCLIVTDTIKESLGQNLFSYAKTISSKTKIIVVDVSREHALRAISRSWEYDAQL